MKFRSLFWPWLFDHGVKGQGKIYQKPVLWLIMWTVLSIFDGVCSYLAQWLICLSFVDYNKGFRSLIWPWSQTKYTIYLTLNVPIATKFVCFSRLLKCIRSLYAKRCRPRSDCSYLFWVHTVCFYSQFVSNVTQLFAADDFSRRHFQMHFFLAL